MSTGAPNRRPHHRLSRLAAVAALASTTTGCGAAASASSKVLAQVGSIEVVDAYLPAPASPSVAAVYLTVRNKGSAPDQLVGLSTPAAPTSMLMTEVDNGSTGSMEMLPALAIPAHGEASLAPGHDHAMLENPTAGTLKVGAKVAVTLRFAHAGSVTLQVPVVPLASIATGSAAGGMSNMPRI